MAFRSFGCRFGFACCRLNDGIGVHLGDTNVLLGVENLALLIGQSPLPFQFLARSLAGLLDAEGLALLVGQLSIGEGLHQLRRRRDVADQRIHRLDVVKLDGHRDMLARFLLALGPVCKEVQNGVGLRGIAEIVAYDGFQHLGHQVLDRAHARDHPGSLSGADVDDLADVEVKSEAVERAHADGAESLVQPVSLAAGIGPIQNDVRGGHQFDTHDLHV